MICSTTDGRARVAILGVAVLAALGACKQQDAEPADHQPDAVYEVRGVIKSLPKPGEDRMFVFHEAIDDFVGRDGAVVGMDAMSMPFRLQAGLSTDGLANADKVKMTVEVHWHADVPLEIASLEKLPAETELDLRRAQPPGD